MVKNKNNDSGFSVIEVMLVLVFFGLIGFVGFKVLHNNKKTDQPSGQHSVMNEGNQFSSDPVVKGKYLSKDNCQGSGSKKLGSAPMKASDIGLIEPYGLVVGGHVTPVDHQYYYAKNQAAAPSTYDVLAPADGTIVSVESRPRGGDKADYRVVISYSCTFFSYFDLANSLSPAISAKLPAGYQTANGPQFVKIPVKQGEVLAKVGGQSLDFAVWDTTKALKGLLVANAYNNYEPWKIHTVAPLDYFADSVKAQVLPFYVRSVEPRDGKLDYDIDGTASGNWFKKGTNGYIGAFKSSEFDPQNYANGHLSISPDLYDPTGWVLSTGTISPGTQFAIIRPTVTPDKLNTSSKIVKYELTEVRHLDQSGSIWMGQSVPKSLKLSTSGVTKATALVQLNAKRELKVEIFEGKTADQVNSFTDAAVIYTRGDGATVMMR